MILIHLGPDSCRPTHINTLLSECEGRQRISALAMSSISEAYRNPSPLRGPTANLGPRIDKYGLPVAVATRGTVSFVTEVTCLYPMIGFIKSKENFIKSKI